MSSETLSVIVLYLPGFTNGAFFSPLCLTGPHKGSQVVIWAIALLV